MTDAPTEPSITHSPRDEVLYEDARMSLRARPAGDGGHEVTLDGPPGIALPRRRSIVTRYPLDLIRAILDAKGPEWVVDEISRDEDPGYTHAYLSLDLPAYAHAEDLSSARILDFGCGGGASTIVIHRLFPEAQLVGVELNPELVALAEQRRQFYGIDNISFLQSPGPNRLPEGLGTFDVVMLSAVWEHLVPEDRDPLVAALWSVLDVGGILVIDQLPHRWFPMESHTTQLPLVNYLPRPLALRAARLSPRVSKDTSWEQLLRDGLRGGTTREIMRRLKRLGHGVEHVKPFGLGVTDEVDLWFKGPSYEGYGPLKPAWNRVARLIQGRLGVAFVPYIAIALRKIDS